MDSAHAWTRVAAIVLHAGLAGVAVVIEDALRTASEVRVSEEVFDAGAGSRSVSLRASSITSARRRIARIDRCLFHDCVTNNRLCAIFLLVR